MRLFPSLPRALPLLLAVVAAAAPAIPACSQAPATGSVPDVRLEVHDNKTSFYLGEPIRLDLVFENHTGDSFMVNSTVYGDLAEKVEITPKEGWFEWQTQSHHDYGTSANLTDVPVRIPLQLDEGFVFREPGEYRVRVTTARLMHGNGLLESSGLPAATTNEVTLELLAMPPDVEKATLDTIREDLANAGNTRSGHALRRHAMDRLATLQGDEALAEKIKLLEDGNEDFRNVYREAFATTHDLQKQLTLLEQAWADPKRMPQYDTPDALGETRLLLAGRNLRGWQMTTGAQPSDAVGQRLAAEHRADMVALLDSMPQRVGEGRTIGAYYLIEFGGLTDAERARAVDYAVQEFPHMDDTEQHMLLETARPPFRDPRLAPMLRSMLAANPSDKDATVAMLAMAPADATTWIVKSVCAPKDVIPFNTFKDATIDRVSDVDGCLAARLRVPPSGPGEEYAWKQRATLAARFASPAILPAIREGWKSPAEDSAVLAVLMRNDPAGAVALLNKEATAGKLEGMVFYEASNVYSQIQKQFPTEVLAWLRAKLDDGSDKEASTAAYGLSIGGDASDVARVEARLERLRGEEQSSEMKQAEMELASALGTYESKTFVDAAERHRLGQGCISDQCRLYLH